MAGTIDETILVRGSYTLPSGDILLNNNIATSRQQITQTDSGHDSRQLDADSAAHTAIAFNVATPGRCGFKCLDNTNFATIGIVVSGTYYPILKLKKFEWNYVRLVPGVTYYIMADTADVKVQMECFSD